MTVANTSNASSFKRKTSKIIPLLIWFFWNISSFRFEPLLLVLISWIFFTFLPFWNWRTRTYLVVWQQRCLCLNSMNLFKLSGFVISIERFWNQSLLLTRKVSHSSKGSKLLKFCAYNFTKFLSRAKSLKLGQFCHLLKVLLGFPLPSKVMAKNNPCHHICLDTQIDLLAARIRICLSVHRPSVTKSAPLSQDIQLL